MKNIGILLLICLFYGCQSDSTSASFESGYKSDQANYSEQEEQSNTNPRLEERKIIKTAGIRFQVKDLKESTARIDAITKEYSGFVSSMNKTNSNYSISNDLTVRIPADKLDAFLQAIEKESIYTDYTRINSQDVTEEYVDITGRLATKKEVRDRYIDILRNKAKTVTEVLEAEEKIRVIQEEIESAEGRLKFLNNRTSLSTVNIEIYQKVDYVKPPDVYQKSFFSKLKESFADGWQLIQELALGLITIWPIVLILLLLFVMRGRIRNVFRKK